MPRYSPRSAPVRAPRRRPRVRREESKGDGWRHRGTARIGERNAPPRDLLRLQRTLGNSHVARWIAQREGGARAGSPAEQAPGEDPSAGTSAGWEPIHELIAEQLGKDAFKEHVEALAARAIDLVMTHAKGARSEADFVARANLDLIGTMLTGEAKKLAAQLASSEGGDALRDRLRTISREQPGVVLAAALAAGAAAYAANADVPKLEQAFKPAPGLGVEGGLDLGKIRELTVRKASLALKLSSKSAGAPAQGGAAGKDDGESEAGEAREIEFKGGLQLDADGTVTVDLGQAIQVDKLRLGTGVSIDEGGMAAIVSIKVGDKNTYVSGKTKVEADGKVSLDLGIKAGDLEVSGKASGLGGETPAGEATVSAKNILGVQGFDAKGQLKLGPAGITSASASAKYSMETRQGTAFISFTAETVPGEKDQPPIGAQGVIGVGFSFR